MVVRLPLIERQCEYDSPKIVRREYFDEFLITAVDLCQYCQNNNLFTRDPFIDRKVIPHTKHKTIPAIKKAISQRKDEIKHLKEKKDALWKADNDLEHIPKLLECFMDLYTLTEEINHLYESYITKLQKTKK